MSYNNQEFPNYMQTAGKISVLAAIVGLAVFIFAFIVDVGHQEIQKVSAQTASTSLQVLNTPPTFTVEPFEVTPSSTTTPTNSGDVVTWSATGNDANGAPYYLLICDDDTNPPIAANGGAPSCGAGAVQWGVSVATPSDDPATVSTTTVEAAPFVESNVWYAWVCDGDVTQAECIVTPSQGAVPTAASSSPFNMNRRPVLTSATPAGAIDPGDTLTFNSVSSDPDSVDTDDNLFLIVCANSGDYNATTNNCDTNFIASTTGAVTDNATAATSTAAVLRDGVRPARAFLVDEHGHEALNNDIVVDYTVNNVTPTIVSGNVVLNNGANLSLTDSSGGETTGFELDFEVSDANSCMNETDVPGSEIEGYQVAVYRTSVGTSTGECNPTDGIYDPNFCYESSQAPAVWNLSCTASSTSCTGPTDTNILYECTFPLWFLADPTDGGPHVGDSWSASVAGVDDQAATSTFVQGASPVPLDSAAYFGLLTAEIPYGGLAPGDGYTTLGVGPDGSATTTVENLGNTRLDQELDGSVMCPTFVSTSSDCSLAASSTVFVESQRFGTTTALYSALGAGATALTTTTVAVAPLDINVAETVATSTYAQGVTYWGIFVPGAVTVAGTYTGLNTIYGAIVDGDW
jgi:hypothetical protein